MKEWLRQFPDLVEAGLVEEDLVLEGREVELWERVIIAHAGCSNAGSALVAVDYADRVIREHRKRVRRLAEGPYR